MPEEKRDSYPKWSLDKGHDMHFLHRNKQSVTCPFRDVLCTTKCRCFKIAEVPCEIKPVGDGKDMVTHVDIVVSCAAANWRSEVVVSEHVPVGEFIY